MTENDTDRSDKWRTRYMPLDEQDPKDLREFTRRAESGEFDGSQELNHAVRAARLLLGGTDESGSSG